MSLPSSTESRPSPALRQRKTGPDIYTVLLVIALVAIIVASILLYLETADYNGQQYRGGPMVYRNAPAATLPTMITHAGPLTSQPGKHGCFNDFSAISDPI